MKTFDVLKPSLDLKKKFFVEASAGCGKTFSIENIVTRLLMDEKDPLSIESILVLTFTKEATSEMKARIRNNIEEVIRQLESAQKSSYPYVEECRRKNEHDRKSILRKLNDALLQFDLAQIFTIHKFCFMALKEFLFEAKLSLGEDVEKSALSPKSYAKVVKDILGFSKSLDTLSYVQLKLLLSYYQNDAEQLLKAVVFQLAKEVKISLPAQPLELKKEYHEKAHAIIKKFQLSKEFILDLYAENALLFKGAVNRKKEIKKDILQAINSFAQSLDSLNLEDGCLTFSSFSKIFKLSNLKKIKKEELEKKSRFIKIHQKIEEKLFPILEEYSRKENLLSLLCFSCQKSIDTLIEKNRILTPNNILSKFNELLKNKEVVERIQKKYSAVIVDEFQDTDPLQWEILSKIFLKNKSKEIPFYLVGDPKQSIYGFRRADIYTYLNAAKMLGVKEVSTLNTNYRSQPLLIEALNALFSQKKHSWLNLPKVNTSLTYKPVESNNTIEIQNFEDDKKSIHFILCQKNKKEKLTSLKEIEEKILFPFFINEINRFYTQLKMPYKSFAILVRDRFQGKRLKEFLKKHHLPFVTTKPETMQGLFIIEAFLQIYQAALDPKQKKYIYALKLNPLFQFLEEDFEKKESHIFQYFNELKKSLFEEGFSTFFQKLMYEKILSSSSIAETLLKMPNGIYYYLELQQIKDLLLQEEVTGLSPYHLYKLIEDLSIEDSLPEKMTPLRQTFEEDGIQILTMHMSKGLEFKVVFALGLINETKVKEELLFDAEQNLLKPSTLFSESELLLYKKEQEAEKMRQLYVAMTRAKQRLYLPVIQSEMRLEIQNASPMDSFLKQIGQSFDTLKEFVLKNSQMSITEHQSEVFVEDKICSDNIKLIEPKIFKKTFPKYYKHSFTSLATHDSSQPSEIAAPNDFLSLEKTLYTLPAGAQTGVLIHRILEKISFQKENLHLEPFLTHTPFAPWKEVIENTIFKLLKAPICIGEKSFCLEDLKQTQVIKEAEFFYPLKGEEKIEEMSKKGDYLQGFIDLICIHNQKYYLVDYKTNWLGYSADDYQNLQQVMESSQYYLQAKIYKEALKKYIRLFDKRPFEECYGGTLYWFIRGVDSQNRGQYFIY